MSRIDSIEVHHYRIPLPVVLSDSTHGEMSRSGLVVAQVRDTDGAEGVGYTYTVNDVGSRAVRALVEHDLAPLLVGEDARAIDRLWERMWWHVHFCGRGGVAAFAMAALDVALWDLEGKRRGEPLWRLLGGHRREVPAYAGGIDLYFPLDALREQARGFMDRGFGAIKMKVGRDRLSEDVERVAAIRDLVGPDFPLMADANMRWQVHEAIAAARALAPFGLVWLEEPVIPDDVDGLARVAVEGGLPVAAGENLHSVYEFEQTITPGPRELPGAGCGHPRRDHPLAQGRPARRGPQPPGDLARHPRRPRAPARCDPERLMAGVPRIRTGTVPRRAAPPPQRQGHRPRPPRPRRRARPGGPRRAPRLSRSSAAGVSYEARSPMDHMSLPVCLTSRKKLAPCAR